MQVTSPLLFGFISTSSLNRQRIEVQLQFEKNVSLSCNFSNHRVKKCKKLSKNWKESEFPQFLAGIYFTVDIWVLNIFTFDIQLHACETLCTL